MSLYAVTAALQGRKRPWDRPGAAAARGRLRLLAAASVQAAGDGPSRPVPRRLTRPCRCTAGRGAASAGAGAPAAGLAAPEGHKRWTEPGGAGGSAGRELVPAGAAGPRPGPGRAPPVSMATGPGRVTLPGRAAPVT